MRSQNANYSLENDRVIISNHYGDGSTHFFCNLIFSPTPLSDPPSRLIPARNEAGRSSVLASAPLATRSNSEGSNACIAPFGN
jgi:hypothetical protein